MGPDLEKTIAKKGWWSDPRRRPSSNPSTAKKKEKNHHQQQLYCLPTPHPVLSFFWVVVGLELMLARQGILPLEPTLFCVGFFEIRSLELFA
jgi:hypothetical protein